MNKYTTLFIIAIIFNCVLLSSCDPSSTYVYTIRNNSTETLSISVLTSAPANNDNSYNSYDKCIYNVIKIEGKDTTLKQYPIAEIKIGSNKDLSFIQYVGMSSFIQDDPEKESQVLWGLHSCVIQISNESGVLPTSIWQDKHNWQKVKEKKRFVEYMLFID